MPPLNHSQRRDDLQIKIALQTLQIGFTRFQQPECYCSPGSSQSPAFARDPVRWITYNLRKHLVLANPSVFIMSIFAVLSMRIWNGHPYGIYYTRG